MKKTLLAIILAAGMHAVSAQALEDSNGFKIIQNGDLVVVKPTLGLRLYVDKQDLVNEDKVVGRYDFNTPEFQGLLKRFDDLKSEDKAFLVHTAEPAVVVQHDDKKHIVQVKMDGLLLWLSQTGIKTDED
jgi:hypothetical protein